MSKLEELIQTLCPDGVEYKSLSDICTVSGRIGFRGYTKQDQVEKGNGALSLSPSNIGENGINFSNSTYINWDKYNESPEIMVSNGDIIFTKTASVGKTEYVDNLPCKATINPQLVLIKEIKCNSKYLSYVLKTKNFQSKVMKIKGQGTIPTISQKEFIKLTVPVPPLEVQQEIVNLLDDFTAKTAELQAELNKEYEARKKQYKYYRDTLLNNNVEIPKIKLGEFAVISRGGNFQKKDFVDNGLPCIHYGQIYTHYGTYADTTLTTINEEAYSKSKKAKKNDIVMAVTSENVEDVCKSVAWLGDKDIAVSGHTAIISHHQNAKYLSYYFSSNAFFKQKKKLAHGTKVIEVTPNTLANIEVPLPSLEIQNRLVEVLDNFDLICSDLNIDLPAEIEARQKQYEYYRDSLLTFAETGSIMPQTDRQTDRQAIIRLIQYVFGYANVKLSDIATQMYRGNGIKRDQVKAEGYPCVRYGELYTEYGISFEKCVSHTNEDLINNPKYIEHGDILFAITGESVEDIGKSTAYTGKEKCLVGGDILVMKHNQNPKYLSYVLSTEESQKQKSKGKIKNKVVHTNAESIGNIEIPLPSLEKQAYLVEILDNFENICNNLQSGLPAEIEARQKQYEY